MKTVGNNRGNTTTDPEKYKKHPYVQKEQVSKKHNLWVVKERNTEIWSNYTCLIRSGRKKPKDHQQWWGQSQFRYKSEKLPNPRVIWKGNCRESTGNSNRNAATGEEKSWKHIMFKRNRNRKNTIRSLKNPEYPCKPWACRRVTRGVEGCWRLQFKTCLKQGKWNNDTLRFGTIILVLRDRKKPRNYQQW